MANTPIKTEIKTINTKQRKGTYIYVKAPKTEGMTLKYNDNIPLTTYKNYYIDKYLEKKDVNFSEYKKEWKTYKTTHKLGKTPNNYLKKLHNQPNIKKLIKKGITNVTIKNTTNITPQKIHQHTKKLLKPLVLDNELLELIAKSENIQKIKHRLEYRIILQDKQGKILGETGVFNKTPEEVLNDLNKSLKPNQTLSQNSTYTLKIEQKGFQKYQHHNDGNYDHSNITIIFRKK